MLEREQSIEATNFNSVRALGGASLEQSPSTTIALVELLTNLEMLHDIYPTLLGNFGSTNIWNRHRTLWLRFGNLRGVGNRRLSPDITTSGSSKPLLAPTTGSDDRTSFSDYLQLSGITHEAATLMQGHGRGAGAPE